jgi:hypothetical protein
MCPPHLAQEVSQAGILPNTLQHLNAMAQAPLQVLLNMKKHAPLILACIWEEVFTSLELPLYTVSWV